jgi:hypothetical protein
MQSALLWQASTQELILLGNVESQELSPGRQHIVKSLLVDTGATTQSLSSRHATQLPARQKSPPDS